MKMKFDLGVGDKSVEATITKAFVQKWYFGREVGEHAVMRLYCEPGDGKTYEFETPIMLQEGCEWEFSKGESRAVTEDDQRDLWGKLLEKFTAFDGPRDLSQESVTALVEWLRSGTAKVRIITKGTTSDRNGVEHHACVIVKPLASAEASAAPSAPKKVAAPAPKKSAAPSAPAKKVKEATRDEAWSVFFNTYAPVHGEAWCADNFVAECEKIIGGEEEFATPELWGKCVATFTAGA